MAQTVQGKNNQKVNIVRVLDDGSLVVANSDGSPIGGASSSSKPTDAYAISDIEETGGFKYFGFEDKDGNWYIMRKEIANSKFYYTAGTSDYATAWTNKDSQVYDIYSSVF